MQDLNQLSFEEKGLICQLTWQSWENILWLVSSGSQQQLKKVVAKPVDWQMHLPETLCIFSDAIPVYLGTATQRVLVPLQTIKEEQKRNYMRRKGKAVPAAKKHHMTAGTGKARAVKDRLTLLARQGLENLFGQEGKPSLKALKGKVLDSILIVHSKNRVRLEDISEAGTWTRDCTFIQHGKREERKKGGKVPGTLMKSWRALRRQHPALFKQGVRVWGHPTACMDEVICAWHSELNEEEALMQLPAMTALHES